MSDPTLLLFLRESLKIEGIDRAPSKDEIGATDAFLMTKALTARSMETLVEIYQPGARLREKPGMNVRIGIYYPPVGSPEIRLALERLLQEIQAGLNIWEVHMQYERLHPFMDGNGRSGRALWLWQWVNQVQRPVPESFLHMFYYQTLRHAKGRGNG